MLARQIRRLTLLLVISGLISATPVRSFAADKAAAKKAAAEKETDEAAGAKTKAKDEPKGRLPAHYADLPVDDAQRKKIYEIQAQHNVEIKKMQEALEAAKAKRDAAVAAVLTPAQQEKLAKIQADEKAKKAKPVMDDKDEKVEDASDATPAKTTKKKAA